ncbi:MAG: Holliday junction branch migration protein RuvA [Candidatus Neomarinimicrobiota bacterium]|nr:MAG: Holliday junction branch migration protein RuvA [Candidatus Neomarinimicrobiota bacterium]
MRRMPWRSPSVISTSRSGDMVDSIAGILVAKTPSTAVVDLHGFRLQLYIAVPTYERLPEPGSPVELLAYLHVREDILALYGFHSLEQREMFRLLTSISGIGPRSAIGILSGTGVETFKERIIAGDVKALTVIPGIGPKTARRIIVELKEKFVADAEEILPVSPAVTAEQKTLVNDVIAALQALGYKRSQAVRAVQEVEQSGELSGNLEDLIKRTLSKL